MAVPDQARVDDIASNVIIRMKGVDVQLSAINIPPVVAMGIADLMHVMAEVGRHFEPAPAGGVGAPLPAIRVKVRNASRQKVVASVPWLRLRPLAVSAS